MYAYQACIKSKKLDEEECKRQEIELIKRETVLCSDNEKQNVMHVYSIIMDNINSIAQKGECSVQFPMGTFKCASCTLAVVLSIIGSQGYKIKEIVNPMYRDSLEYYGSEGIYSDYIISWNVL